MKSTITVDEYHRLAKKPPKYRNVKTQRTTANGNVITFDSKREADRYDELMLMVKAGNITDLKLQPQFTLQESYVTPEGERVRAIRYTADFSYYEYLDVECLVEPFNKEFVVEDVKSTATRTKDYLLKKKLMMGQHGIQIVEV